MRAIQTQVITFCMLVIIVTSSTRAQKSDHVPNNHELSIAIEEMEKANYFSFVMLINMLPSVNPRFLANVTFLMPKDKTLSRSNIINQQDSVSEFLLRHSIPSSLLFEHLNLIPNGSIVPSSLPHYTLEISNGGRSNYFLNNVKIISRNICSLGSIKCHGIDGILQSPSTIDDDSPRNNHTLPFISCPSSHNNSDQSSHNNSSRPAHTLTAPPPASSPLPKSDSPSIHEVKMLNSIVIPLLGLLAGLICM
ncbi:FAS1 domain [Arabidopsis thaliana x Arabidopsis arenosa]|uniref:FAS1 domain n=1 Tax=Arabidopsis thaliana x Arabidopsis arenosa TaxID=1240361 RepID=A0A8T1YWR2_9BRAS|nr:FAS1 domain [Arabidopsis thaliana x Arabidopsis arenosa]